LSIAAKVRTVRDRLLPVRIDNDYHGRGAALWLLGTYIALKLIMSLNSIFNARSVATGADGLQLDALPLEGAQTLLLLFALVAVGQLFLTLIALLALVRYRAMVPLVFALLLLEHLCRRAVALEYAIARDGQPVGTYISLGLMAILLTGLVLSLAGPADRRAAAP
jgi:hypothetical protein